MGIWGDVYDRELAKGADHGHAAFMADVAEARAKQKDSRSQLTRVIDTLVDDILKASDEEILAEAEEEGWTKEDLDHLRETLKGVQA